MAEIMTHRELKWAVPSEPNTRLDLDLPPAKRSPSPDQTGRGSYKTQKSISEVLGPVMADVHLEAGGQEAGAREIPAEQGALFSGNSGHVNLDLLVEAETLLSKDSGAFDFEVNNVAKDETDGDVKDQGGHRVRDIIHKYESTGESKQDAGHFNEGPVVDERISASTAEDKECFLLRPDRLIAKTVHKVKEAAKIVGRTVIDGVQDGVKELVHVVHKFRLPQSSLEENPQNNIHVLHPDKSACRMVGLGMNIQKDVRGHVVHTVLPDGFAERSQIQNKDVIIGVNGNDVTSWEFAKLQQFFGSLEEVEFNIVVEREGQDESGETVCKKITFTIKLSIEGDEFMVLVDIKYGISGWKYIGHTEPLYIFQERNGITKYLTFDSGKFCMSAPSDLTHSRIKLLEYSPVQWGPSAIIGMSSCLPVDHMESYRVGARSSDMYGDHLDTSDSRIFYNVRQSNTGDHTFELASCSGKFLTVDSAGNLTTTPFSDVEAVQPSGLFGMASVAEVDKLPPSDIMKFSGKSGNSTGKSLKW